MVDYSCLKTRKRRSPKKFGSTTVDNREQQPPAKQTRVKSKEEITCRIKTLDGISKAKIATITRPPISTSANNIKVDAVTSGTSPMVQLKTNRKRKKAKAVIKKEAQSPPLECTSSSSTKISRPTVEECEYVTEALTKWHPEVVDHNRNQTILESCGKRKCVTEAIISTMLSQNTTDANSKAAFASLRKTFGNDWTEVASASNLEKLENSIRVAGLASTRSKRIQTMLQMVMNEHDGNPSMEYLRAMTNEDIKRELSRFPGLGPKTISCVLLFALNRQDEFPVDTHVFRICNERLHWLPNSMKQKNRNTAYDYLNTKIPSHLKLDLHCLLVKHGKQCYKCAANNRPQFPPNHDLPCPLTHINKWNGNLPFPSILLNYITDSKPTLPVVMSSSTQIAAQIKQEVPGDKIPDELSSNHQVQLTTLTKALVKQEFVPEIASSNDQVKPM